MPPDNSEPHSSVETQPDRSRFYIPALDGLRTVAFLMVWWAHALPIHTPFSGPPISWWNGFVLSGGYGVPIFFALSAFLITRLLLTERERTGTIDLRAYYIRRTLRIWPLYFLIVVLAIGYWAQQGHVPTGVTLSLLTFTSNWYQSFHGGANGFSAVLWSVSVEEQFYLVWPLVLSYLSVRGVKILCAVMIVVVLLSRVLLVQAGHDGAGIWFSTFTHLDSLALGTLLAFNSERLPQLNRWSWWLVFIGCLALFAVQARHFPINYRETPFDLASAIGYVAVPFVAVTLVALAAGSRNSLLERPFMVSAGRLTYGLYCFHLMVLTAIHGRTPLHLLASLVITYILAWASYHLYERRFLRLKHRFERVPSRPD